MEFRLLTQTSEELDVQVLKGKLMSAGIMVRLDSKFTKPSRYSIPDLFGVYVPQQQWEAAQKVLSEFHPLKPQSQFRVINTVHKGYVVIFLVAFLASVMWWFADMIKNIFNP